MNEEIRDPREIAAEKLRLVDLTKDNLRKGKETLCPKCGGRIDVITGLIDGDPNQTTCRCGYMNYREIFMMRPFANGKRRWNYELTEQDKKYVIRLLNRLNIPVDHIQFVSKEHGTAYLPDTDIINISGNVFPDLNYPDNIQDIMPVSCVLAHEWYGHRRRRQGYLNNVRYEYDVDEALASRDAARYCPNLTKEEKLYLYSHVTMHVALGNYSNLLTLEEKQFILGMIDDIAPFCEANNSSNIMSNIMQDIK